MHLYDELRFEIFFHFLFFCGSRKVLLIRLEKKSAARRLAMWLRSLVLTCASPPKTNAFDHFSFSVYRGVGLQSGVKFTRI